MISDPSRINPKRLLSKLRLAATGMLLSAAAGMALYAATPDSSGSSKSGNGVYIVQMQDAPAVAYKGGVAGYKATAPKKGEKIDPLAPDVAKYVGYLKSKHDAALAKVGHGQKLYSYGFSINGFAAKLTPAQAAAMAKQDGVVAVSKDELMTADTSTTPASLGLTNPGGLWDQLGGVGGKKTSGAGENIVIGVIDTGVWPESKSFTDRDATGKLIFQQIPGFHGKCESSGTTDDPSWNANLCNQKLIAARHYNAGFGGDAGVAATLPWEFRSPRDYNGHGSHTASTAAGNNSVQIPSTSLNLSGMAPRARVAVYKALWHQADGTGSGFTSDLVAGIDQAVADGVDVINYSVSGSTTNFLNPVEVAFLNAADAGIFVATSAGNSGPGSSTVAHPAPWETTVAAANHPGHTGTSSVVLGNSATYNGASFASPVGPAPVVLASASGLPGADPDLLRQCFSNPVVLDPAKIAGKIVVCERGGFTPPPLAANARVDKSFAVQQGGGIGMILVNVLAGATLNSDIHAVPTIHLNNVDGAAVKTYVSGAGAAATAKINQSTITSPNVAPVTASFSSRGPSLAASGDILKPDVIAPGVDVLAAVAPTAFNAGQNFASFQGTSMSSPHVAGVAALLKQLHPNWSPMMIKSALMTTGYDVLDPSIADSTRIFRQGAGHIRPNSAADPGLVFDSNANDWLAFLCGTTTGVNPATCTALAGAGYSFDPSDMNTASIAIGDLLETSQTVKRRVTNVGNTSATYTAAYTGMPGLNVAISPASLTLNPGQTGSFTVTFTKTPSHTPGVYAAGQLTWTGAGHSVRIPMVVRPIPLSAPAQVSGTGTPINYNVRFGYTGPFTAAPRGLVPASKNTDTVATGASKSYVVAIPAGTSYARFSLFDQPGVSDDLDLEVRNAANQLVGASGGLTTTEEVNLLTPAAGNYTVTVVGFATQNPTANFTLFNWVLGTGSAGNMTVNAPASATIGTTAPITLTFSGLTPDTKYLGSVAYSGAAGMPNPTIVRVDMP